MTILMSGVNMYAMAVVMKVVLGWNIHFSIWVSSLTVGVYVASGGLYSAIFNEVLQFFLIWFGALLIPILGLIETGGWSGMVARIQQNFPGQDYTHLWRTLGHATDNPMGMHWTGIVFGLGAVLSMGYWTTDFLVVQRVLAAKDIRSAKMAPVIGSFFKMAVPLIVILPGLLGLAVLPEHLVPESAMQAGQHSYNEVLPLMLARYFGPGLLGLGVTALIAGFMAGMAGNVSAFATVWTYDIYRPFCARPRPTRTMSPWAAGARSSASSSASAPRISPWASPASWITSRRCSVSLSRRCSAPYCSACCGNEPPVPADSGDCWPASDRPSRCFSW